MGTPRNRRTGFPRAVFLLLLIVAIIVFVPPFWSLCNRENVPDSPEELVSVYLNEALRFCKAQRELERRGGQGTVDFDATRYRAAKAKMVDLGNAALPQLEEQYARLSPQEQSLLLDHPEDRFRCWPILTQEAGAFLFDTSGRLPRQARMNALVLSSICGHRPALPSVQEMYEAVLREQEQHNLGKLGVALALLGDYRHLPYWASELLRLADGGTGSDRFIHLIIAARALPQMLGPIDHYLRRSESRFPRAYGDLAKQLLRAVGVRDPGPQVPPMEAWRQWTDLPAQRNTRLRSWVLVGKLALSQGRKQLAERCFEEAARLSPPHSQPRLAANNR